MVVAVSAIGVVLFWTIMFFNRPRFLVAPHLRDQAGILNRRLNRRYL